MGGTHAGKYEFDSRYSGVTSFNYEKSLIFDTGREGRILVGHVVWRVDISARHICPTIIPPLVAHGGSSPATLFPPPFQAKAPELEAGEDPPWATRPVDFEAASLHPIEGAGVGPRQGVAVGL